MPYLHPLDREHASREYPRSPGELTYAIQQAIQEYLFHTGLTYAHIAEVLGSLEGAKADFVRRVVTPYEQRKQAENTDVWHPAIALDV